MRIRMEYLVDWLTMARSRAAEVRDVRSRLMKQAGPNLAPESERDVAIALRRLREELAAAFCGVKSCRECVRPRSVDWPGGHCCSGRTRDIFTDHELSALALSGTTPRQLRPPHSRQVGCAFRGPRGCSLEPAHRPCLCLRYACRELESELEQTADGPRIKQLRTELRLGFEQLVRLRTEHDDATRMAECEASLRDCARKE